MAGRKRKHDPTIPKHIDQNLLPKGIYWSGAGWYVREPDPMVHGRKKAVTILGRNATLAAIHTAMERRNRPTKGTIGACLDAYHQSVKFNGLADGTRKNYESFRHTIRNVQNHQGEPLTAVKIDTLTAPFFQAYHDKIAYTDGHKTKARHIVGYLKSVFAWGIAYGQCKTNPASEVQYAKRNPQSGMPTAQTYKRMVEWLRRQGKVPTHIKHSQPDWLWAAYVIAYKCKLRTCELIKLTDADLIDEGVINRRAKGSKTNATAWDDELKQAVDHLLKRRKQTWKAKKIPAPIQPEHRYILVSKKGQRFASTSSIKTAVQRAKRAAYECGVLSPDEPFHFHGLKHRGITDSKNPAAGGHVDPRQMGAYDHAIELFEPPKADPFSNSFSKTNLRIIKDGG